MPWLRKEPSYQDLVHSTRGLSFASAKAVFAGRLLHLEDIAVCASMGKSAISELLVTGAALAWSAELEEDKTQWVEACEYIHTIFIGKPFLYMCIYIPYLAAGIYTYIAVSFPESHLSSYQNPPSHEGDDCCMGALMIVPNQQSLFCAVLHSSQ